MSRSFGMLLSLFARDNHLKLCILHKEDQGFRLIWDKVLNPSRVEIIHLIKSERSTHNNLFVNVLVLESFTFSEAQTSLFSLFTVCDVPSDENLSISSKDTVTISSSVTISKYLIEFTVTPASCDIC